MATVIINDNPIQIPDGEKIVDHIEKAGVPIGCSNGVCGTCEVEVLEGMENLNPLTAEEQDLGMEGNRRLGCQCVIQSGSVKIAY